jgi:antitoxin CptB
VTDAALARKKLGWACRRGMRELDVLLDRYLQSHYAAASSDEQAAFEQLVQLQDPELARYLLARVDPDNAALAAVVRKISPRD